MLIEIIIIFRLLKLSALWFDDSGFYFQAVELRFKGWGKTRLLVDLMAG